MVPLRSSARITSQDAVLAAREHAPQQSHLARHEVGGPQRRRVEAEHGRPPDGLRLEREAVLVVEADVEAAGRRADVGGAQGAEPPGGVEDHRVERRAHRQRPGGDAMVVDDRQLVGGRGRRVVDPREQQPVLVDEISLAVDLPGQQGDPLGHVDPHRVGQGDRDRGVADRRQHGEPVDEVAGAEREQVLAVGDGERREHRVLRRPGHARDVEAAHREGAGAGRPVQPGERHEQREQRAGADRREAGRAATDGARAADPRSLPRRGASTLHRQRGRSAALRRCRTRPAARSSARSTTRLQTAAKS